ncbi:unnamed protein product, partial [Amoebophrya sp. A25]
GNSTTVAISFDGDAEPILNEERPSAAVPTSFASGTTSRDTEPQPATSFLHEKENAMHTADVWMRSDLYPSEHVIKNDAALRSAADSASSDKATGESASSYKLTADAQSFYKATADSAHSDKVADDSASSDTTKIDPTSFLDLTKG